MEGFHPDFQKVPPDPLIPGLHFLWLNPLVVSAVVSFPAVGQGIVEMPMVYIGFWDSGIHAKSGDLRTFLLSAILTKAFYLCWEKPFSLGNSPALVSSSQGGGGYKGRRARRGRCIQGVWK